MGARERHRGRLDDELVGELEEIARDIGCELIHAELQGGKLQLVLDREDTPGGVTLDDCQTVSKQASALLDVVDAIPGRYVLEVTSPGLDRKLYRPRDYARFQGRLARVTFLTPEERKKQTVVGRLEAFEPGGDDHGDRVTVVERDSGTAYVLPLEDVQLARLEIEL